MATAIQPPILESPDADASAPDVERTVRRRTEEHLIALESRRRAGRVPVALSAAPAQPQSR